MILNKRKIMKLIHNRKMKILRGINNKRMIKNRAFCKNRIKMTLQRSLKRKNHQHQLKNQHKRKKLLTTITNNPNNF